MARRGKKKRKPGAGDPATEGLQGNAAARRSKPVKVATGLSPLIKAALQARARAQQADEATKAGPAKNAVPFQDSPSAQAAHVNHHRSPAPAAPSSPDASDWSWRGHDSPSEPEARSAGDLRLLNDAYEGVVPLAHAPRRSTQRAAARLPVARTLISQGTTPTAEDAARQRLNALVGEGVRFRIEVDEDGEAEALREGVGRRELKRLRSPSFHAEAELDLHGERAQRVDSVVTQFVRRHHRAGCRYLLIVHGKGLHSSGRCGVLGEAVLHSLTAGGAAPLVRALSHAHPLRGGRGAMAIALM